MGPGRAAGWLLAAWMAGLTSAHARPSRAVVIAAATAGHDDVTRTVLIGPAGQIYLPGPPGHAPGTWQRRTGGGTSVTVTNAVEVPGQAIFACGARAPMFRANADQGIWRVHRLGNRGSCTMSTGRAPAMAIGPHIYTWRNQRWLRLRSAPAPVTALWAASASQVYAATAPGQLLRTRAGTWSTIRHSLTQDDPIEHVAGHAGHAAYALSRSGALLRLGAAAATLVVREPALTSFQPQAMAAAPDGTLWVAGIVPASDSGPARAVLAHADRKRMRMIEALLPLQPEERISVLRVDARGGMLWATSSGTLRYRIQGGSWQEGTILGELPRPLSSVPGRRPAHTR